MKQNHLENEIENMRKQLYEAYLNGCEYSHLLQLSQKLDDLMNQLYTA
ncbi:Spo0E family sporulation regulatory protein-aspartic acid phosphatase [Halobacillus sp. B23F22_1]